MKLTPEQLREVLEVSEETLRYWKRSLPPIRDRNGYQPCYSFQDTMALAVIGILVKRVGLPIGKLSQSGERIFSIFEGVAFLGIETQCLLLDCDGSNVRLIERLADASLRTPSIVLPLRQILDDVRQRVMDALGLGPAQMPLAFPPVSVKPAVRTAS